MIKLKDLLTEDNEKEEAFKKAFENYWTFTMNAVGGRNPDSFYRAHHKDIDLMAALYVKKYGPTTGGTAWRGIILDPSEVHNGKVNHLPHITYVSFSEDKQIAIAFGDTENIMSAFMRVRYPNKKGYLITAGWRPEHLLFYWKWIFEEKIRALAIQLIGNDNVKVIEEQKEIMIKPRPYYRLEPVPPGASGGIEP